MNASPSLLDQLGGPEVLRGVIEEFVGLVCDDVMIGFLFADVDRAQLIAREFEFAARHLGGDVRYTGRPLKDVHAPRRIQGGQFERRLTILRQTLARHAAPDPVVTHWLDHNRALRPLITSDAGGNCATNPTPND